MRTDRKQVNIIYDGLDVNCEITSIDPLDQVFYAGSNTYIPNRSLTPLVLIPKLEIMNSSGAKVATAFTKTSWYFGEIKEGTLITSKVSTDDYYIDGLNLVVKKNLDNPIQISFLGEFIDKRTKKIIQVPRVVELSVLSTSEIAPAPTIGIDRPADWAFNPIRDSNIQTLTASVFVNEKAYASAVRWLVEHNGKKEAIDLYDCYVSGQHSHQLIVDTDKLPSGALIWAENVSEEFYNKVYGINPDWDDKMSEVFENRNLVLNTTMNSNNYSRWASSGTMSFSKDIARIDYTKPYSFNQIGFINSTPTDLIKGVQYFIIFWARGNSSTHLNYVYLLREQGSSEVNISLNNDNPDKKKLNPQTFHKFVIKYTPSRDESSLRLLIGCADVNYGDFLEIQGGIMITTTPIVSYTPAPENLNFRNLAVNALANTRLYASKNVSDSIIDGVKYFKGITYDTSNTTGNNLFFILKELYLKGYPTGYKFTLSFKLKVNKDTPISMTANNAKHNIVSGDKVTKDKEYQFYSFMEIANSDAAHYNTHIAMAEKPTEIQLYDINIYDEHIELPYFPTAKELAPDGILPGTYSTNVPFFVKYPSLKVSVADFGDLLESDPSHKLEAEVIYNKGRLDNPSKYIDNQFIIGYANDREEVVGTGNSVVVPAAKFQGAKYVDMEWNFKKRPLTLTEYKQTKLIEE